MSGMEIILPWLLAKTVSLWKPLLHIPGQYGIAITPNKVSDYPIIKWSLTVLRHSLRKALMFPTRPTNVCFMLPAIKSIVGITIPPLRSRPNLGARWMTWKGLKLPVLPSVRITSSFMLASINLRQVVWTVRFICWIATPVKTKEILPIWTWHTSPWK